jgi:Ca2+-binding EF-hand superfamily protein
MINEIDVDGSGQVEFAEFVILMTHKVREMEKDEELREAFNVLDKDKDGSISARELKYFMRKVAHLKLSSEEADAMIEFASNSNDGLVSF